MPKWSIFYLDGPCKTRTGQIVTMGNQPDAERTCGGWVYVYYRSAAGEGAAGTIGVATYGVQGGTYDRTAVRIRGERDVFRAWSRLHATMNRTVGQQRLRVRRAGSRIRRAVR